MDGDPRAANVQARDRAAVGVGRIRPGARRSDPANGSRAADSGALDPASPATPTASAPSTQSSACASKTAAARLRRAAERGCSSPAKAPRAPTTSRSSTAGYRSCSRSCSGMSFLLADGRLPLDRRARQGDPAQPALRRCRLRSARARLPGGRWRRSAGFQQVDAIEAWLPLFLFSVLFGLSMDYHVLLLSRIRERFTLTGDNTEAVASGVASTARLITGAALIIIAVYVGFASGELVIFQQLGFGVAVALLIDATLIRLVLLPASMRLLGNWNWYLPSWLEWIPNAQVERAPECTSEDRAARDRPLRASLPRAVRDRARAARAARAAAGAASLRRRGRVGRGGAARAARGHLARAARAGAGCCARPLLEGARFDPARPGDLVSECADRGVSRSALRDRARPARPRGKAARRAGLARCWAPLARAPCPATRPLSPGRPARSPRTRCGGRSAASTTFKLKVGVDGDVEQVRAVRDALGPGARLRVDANGAWTREQAVAKLGELDPCALELAEQPAPHAGRHDRRARARRRPDRRRRERRRTSARRGWPPPRAPATASPSRSPRWEASPPRSAIAGVLPTYLSSALDGPVGIAAAAHLAQVLPGGDLTDRAHGLATAELFADRVASVECEVANAALTPSDAPGLGSRSTRARSRGLGSSA